MGFSPDGKRLVSASRDGLVRVWDLRTGRELLGLPAGAPMAAAFTPNGRLIVSAGGDRVIRMWDGTPEKEVLPGN